MAPKKLFLAHYSEWAGEVAQLATELRLRGIVPWVDKDGGFNIGDHTADEATRAIMRDCLGLLLYATEDAFEREFIVKVEVAAARDTKETNDKFLLFAVPRRMSFQMLKELSIEKVGFDLSPYHTVGLPDDHALQQGCAKVAHEVLINVLKGTALQPGRSLVIQVSTRELMPHEDDEVLCVNAVPLLERDVRDEAAWARLLSGLADIKLEVSRRWGRPRLRIEGSKHLTAAFMVGRVFSPMEMDIRQTSDAYWASDAQPSGKVLKPQLVLTHGEPILTLEVASRIKDVVAGVDAYARASGLNPAGRLQLAPIDPPLEVDEAVCRSMVVQTYFEIEKAIKQMGLVREIHIFAAAPQSYMMLLAREFKGMPATVHYEWAGDQYLRACTIPGGPL